MLIDMKEEDGPDPDYRIPENPNSDREFSDPSQPNNINLSNAVPSHASFMVGR